MRTPSPMTMNPNDGQTALTIDEIMCISDDLWCIVPEHQTVITINDRTRSILIRGIRRRNERKRFVRRTILSRMTNRQARRAMIAR